MSETITGGCLCGAIRYKATGKVNPRTDICHCVHCSKISGSSFSIQTMYKDELVEITDDEKLLRGFDDTKTDSGKPLTREFCSKCGSWLFLRNPDMAEKGYMMVTAGSRDREFADVKPNVEIYMQGRKSWLPKFEGTKCFDKEG